MKQIIFFSLLLCSVYQYIHAQKTDSNVFGHAVCYGEHLPGIHIYIKGTQFGTVTDRTGHYFLYNLPVGEHTLVASGIGFQTQEQTVKIHTNSTIEIDFELHREVHLASEVVITGSRVEEDRRDVPVVVNIIKTELLTLTNSKNVADVLGYQSGLRVENNCQNCGFQQVRINGLEGTYSQILVDGRPVFSALAGVYGLEQIPATMIDRIEIVKGGGSATYGSNAIAGTINVITRDPLYNSFQIGHNLSAYRSDTYDNNSFFNSTVLNNGNSGGITIFGNIRNRQFLDYDNDGFTEVPLLKMTGVGFKAFNRLNKQSKISLEYHNINDFRRGGNNLHLVPHLTDITEQAAHQIHSGSAVFEHLLKDNSGRLNVFSSYRHTERDTYYGVALDENAYGTSLDNVSFTGIEYLRFFKGQLSPDTWLLGADFHHNSLEDRQTAYGRKLDQTTWNFAVFTQGSWKTGPFTMLAGVRADKHNFVNHIILSPRINVLVNLNEHIQGRAGVSTGFRAPQAFDEDLHILAVGGEVQLIELDDQLKPETSVSYNASLEWTPKSRKNKFTVLTEAFFTGLRDVFILQNGGNDQSGRMLMLRTNGESAFVTGLNTEIRYTPHTDLDIMLGYTYQKSMYTEPVQWSDDPDVSLSRQMFRSPEHYGFTTVNMRLKNDFRVSATGIYTGNMIVPHYAGYIESDRLEKTPDFWDLSLSISKKISLPKQLNLEISGGIKNLLNSFQKDFDRGVERDASYIYGPMYPRQIFIGIKFGNFI